MDFPKFWALSMSTARRSKPKHGSKKEARERIIPCYETRPRKFWRNKKSANSNKKLFLFFCFFLLFFFLGAKIHDKHKEKNKENPKLLIKINGTKAYRLRHDSLHDKLRSGTGPKCERVASNSFLLLLLILELSHGILWYGAHKSSGLGDVESWGGPWAREELRREVRVRWPCPWGERL